MIEGFVVFTVILDFGHCDGDYGSLLDKGAFHVHSVDVAVWCCHSPADWRCALDRLFATARVIGIVVICIRMVDIVIIRILVYYNTIVYNMLFACTSIRRWELPHCPPPLLPA